MLLVNKQWQRSYSEVKNNYVADTEKQYVNQWLFNRPVTGNSILMQIIIHYKNYATMSLNIINIFFAFAGIGNGRMSMEGNVSLIEINNHKIYYVKNLIHTHAAWQQNQISVENCTSFFSQYFVLSTFCKWSFQLSLLILVAWMVSGLNALSTQVSLYHTYFHWYLW